jgi:hypothetical protein
MSRATKITAKAKKPSVKRKPATKRARPSPSQDRLDAAGADTICTKIAEGTSYRQIAAEYKVGLGRLAAWIEADAERSRACARAREIAATAFDERALEGLEAASEPFELARAREVASHLRWRAKAANPKRYGEKVAHGGTDDLPPIQTRGEVDVKLDPSEAYKRMMAGG